MFKSVFTKYITAFMLIIAISFVILALILCQMVGNFSSDTKSQTTRQSAETLSSYLNQHYLEDDDYEYFSQYIYFNSSASTISFFIK